MHIVKLDSKKLQKASHEDDMSMLFKQVLFDWKERGEEIKGRLSMFNYAVLKPSGYFNQHSHGDKNIGMTEFFYILEGNALVKIDEKEYEVEKNTLVIVDSGEVHSMKNTSNTQPVIYIVFGVSSGSDTKVIKKSY